MPFVRISMFPRPQEVKKALAKDLTAVISKHCRIPPEATWILFEDVPQERWAMGGELKGC